MALAKSVTSQKSWGKARRSPLIYTLNVLPSNTYHLWLRNNSAIFVELFSSARTQHGRPPRDHTSATLRHTTPHYTTCCSAKISGAGERMSLAELSYSQLKHVRIPPPSLRGCLSLEKFLCVKLPSVLAGECVEFRDNVILRNIFWRRDVRYIFACNMTYVHTCMLGKIHEYILEYNKGDRNNRKIVLCNIHIGKLYLR